MKRADVSWRVDYPLKRQFGQFIRWEGDLAVIRHGVKIIRIPRRDISFEVG